MNPLLYKAHPLLFLTVDLFANPAAHSIGDWARLSAIYLALNLAWTPLLLLGAKKAVGFAPSLARAYGLALPALVFYLPLIVTLLSDVLAHEFRYVERFIPVFCVFVASQMLTVFYGSMLKYPRNGRPIGLGDGFAISLFLLLVSLPMGLVFLWLNGALKIV
jgi:hypothetical protein